MWKVRKLSAVKKSPCPSIFGTDPIMRFAPSLTSPLIFAFLGSIVISMPLQVPEAYATDPTQYLREIREN